ncbi:MAG: MFS transporter, partial [Bryobacteraceae bacterium]
MPRLAAGKMVSPWLVVALLWVAFLINYVDRQSVFSIYPVLKRDLHLSDPQLGLAGTVFIWTYSLCMPFTGRLADLFRRDRIIIASIVLWSLATLGTGL